MNGEPGKLLHGLRRVNWPRTLAWALRHPANRGHTLWVLQRWIAHQIRKRVRPQAVVRRQVFGGVIVGPAAHPSVFLATYVRGGIVDPDAFVAYAAILQRGDHFLDVGAAIGLHAVAASRFVGSEGRIVCVEPDSSERAWLARTREENALVWEVEERPVADCSRPLVWRRAGPASSHLEAAIAAGREAGVVTTTVDEVISRFAMCPRRLVIKIDVEGWEAAVLVGGGKSVQGGVKAVWLEAIGLQERCDVRWDEAVSMLTSCGYRPYVVDIEARVILPGRLPLPPVSPFGNYLFLRDESLLDRVRRYLAEWERHLCVWAAAK
jgi:FkbM family methyltransferase